MYSTSPYYEYPVKVEKPKCMYDMKNIYSNCELHQPMEMPESVIMNGYEKTQVANLEKRQISLINQLKDLTLLLKNIKEKLLAGPPNKIGPVIHPLKAGHLLDIVASVPPTYSLFALVILSKWLQQRYSVQIHVHLHSTLKNIKKNWTEIIDGQKTNSHTRTSNQLIITVIFKEDIDVPQLRVSTKQRTPIAGEANILRYLATLMWPMNSFEDPVQLTEVDQWLDLTHLNLQEERVVKEVLAQLNSHLARNKYLVGGTVSIADVGLLSALCRTDVASSKLPQHVKRWKETCCSDPGIKLAWEQLTLA